jgi:cytochrome c peroxidase
MRLTILALCFILGGALVITACRKKGLRNAPPTTPYTLPVPAGFPPPAVDMTANPLTEEGIALGKQLFYDKRLSIDNTTPCAACHQQVAAFTIYDHDLGHGVYKQHTTRNPPGLCNLAWQKTFQQDGSITDLLQQPLEHFNKPNEMGENIDDIVEELKDDDEYKSLFFAAFGNETVTGEGILKSLEQFVLTLVSADSKYDRVKKGQAQFDASQAAGYEIFKANCASCHAEPLFTDGSFRNIGLDINGAKKDYGRMMVTGLSEDSLKFRVPSLRNVGETEYYTHDGRFEFLSGMFDHYSDSVRNSPTLDPLLTNKIPLTATDKFYLEEFLFTLTDSTFLRDPAFGTP